MNELMILRTNNIGHVEELNMEILYKIRIGIEKQADAELGKLEGIGREFVI